VVGIVVQVVINAIALGIAVRVVPGMHFAAVQHFPASDWPQIVGVATLFGVVNTFIRPVVKMLTFPITLMSLGLFGFVVNGLLLLAVAWASRDFGIRFTISGFPPDMSLSAIGSATIAAIVIGVLSAVIALVVDRVPALR